MSELTAEMKAQGYKRFRCRTGEIARVTHPSGSIQLIGDEFVPVHPDLHRDAYANGAFDEDTVRGFMSAGSGAGEEPPTLSSEQRKEKILEAMAALANSGDASAFTGSGVPNANVLSSMVGFTVTADERDAIWKELQADGD